MSAPSVVTGPELVWEVDPIKGDMAPFFVEGNKRTRASFAAMPGSQDMFMRSPIRELLYEGTRGPGKTMALLMDFCQHVGQDTRTKQQISSGEPQKTGWGSGWRGIIFRQSFPDLKDLIKKSKELIPSVWPDATYNEAKSFWLWPDGEMLIFSFIQTESDFEKKYKGHEYQYIGWEELTTWASPKVYLLMMSCNRSPIFGMPLKIRSTTNSGGVGHNWVKARWRLKTSDNRRIGDFIETEGEHTRCSVRGYLKENIIIMHADPDYIKTLRASAGGSESKIRSWIYGDWDIIAGGMFDDVWSQKHHCIPACDVPSSWRIDRTFDWGSSKPFSLGWWAESDGTDLVLPDGTIMSTVAGDLFRIREFYGCKKDTPNEGLRLTAKEIAKEGIRLEREWGIANRVRPGPADGSIYDVENGHSIASDMEKEGMYFVRANKNPGSRINGWELIRTRFKAGKAIIGRENPSLYVFAEHCPDFVRTIPVLPRDKKKVDDIDTDSEDHIADEVRYRVLAMVKRLIQSTHVGMS